MTTLRQRFPAAPIIQVVDSKEDISSDDSDSISVADEDLSLPTFTPPTFTIKQLLSAIPAHCHERSALKSSAYIVQDAIFVGALVYAATFISSLFGARGSLLDGVAGQAAAVLAWSAYAFACGLPATGLWVIAHECGHQAFSPSKTINNAVGWVLHSALLVPYHSWRISHGKHHAATGHMTRDQVFVPRTRSQLYERMGRVKAKVGEVYDYADEVLEDAPLWVLANVFAQQLFGWPMYLLTDASSSKKDRRASHFEPNSPIFDVRHFMQIVASDVGLALTIGALSTWGYYRGFSEVFLYYLMPYLWVNNNLVIITFLQHTDPNLPHYREGEWNFQRGALCTVDRSYFDFFTHNICDTHVAHHLCSKIPHYHGHEATNALKEVLGEHYRYDPTNLFVALYRNYRDCRYVADTGDVVFFKNGQHKQARRVVYDTPVSDSGIDCPADSKIAS